MNVPITRLAVAFPSSLPAIDYDSYDTVVLFFSGGKDSLACLLSLSSAAFTGSFLTPMTRFPMRRNMYRFICSLLVS